MESSFYICLLILATSNLVSRSWQDPVPTLLPLLLAEAEAGSGKTRETDSVEGEINLTARSAEEPEALVEQSNGEMPGLEDGTRIGSVHGREEADEKEGGKGPLEIGERQMGERGSIEYAKVDAEQAFPDTEGESGAVEESVTVIRSPELESAVAVESGKGDVSGSQSQRRLGRLVVPCSLSVDAPLKTSFGPRLCRVCGVLPFLFPRCIPAGKDDKAEELPQRTSLALPFSDSLPQLAVPQLPQMPQVRSVVYIPFPSISLFVCDFSRPVCARWRISRCRNSKWAR